MKGKKATAALSTIFFLIFISACTAVRNGQKAPTPVPEVPQRKEFTIYTQIPADVEYIRDVEFGRGGDKPLKMNILRPKKKPAKPMPVIVWIHGGGWNSGSREDFLESFSAFAQAGYFFASIEYRLSSEAAFPAQIQDSKCAIRYLRAKAGDYNIDADRIGVWGASAGGYLASLAGTAGDVKEFEGTGGWQEFSSKVRAVCDWYGPSDFTVPDGEAVGLVELLLGGSPTANKEAARRASVTTYISGDDPPFLIMHGDNDSVVPVSQSTLLNNKLKAAGVDATLTIVQGAGHGFARVQDMETVLNFFDKQLLGK